jgi:hypothetical protein
MSDSITLVAAGEHQSHGASVPLDCSAYSTLRLDLACTVVGGVPALPSAVDVRLETSSDGSSWRLLREFLSLATVEIQRALVTNHDTYVRATWLENPQEGQPLSQWSLTGEALPEAAS